MSSSPTGRSSRNDASWPQGKEARSAAPTTEESLGQRLGSRTFPSPGHPTSPLKVRLPASVIALPRFGRAFAAPMPSGQDQGEPRDSPNAHLDIQVDDVEGVVFYEFAAVLDVFAHERGENLFGFHHGLGLQLEQRARFRVHGG